MNPDGRLTPEMRTRLKQLVKEYYRRIVAYLHRYLSDQTTLVDLHYFQSTPTVQITESLGTTPDSLRISLMRIRRALKTCIEEQRSPEATT